MRKKDSKKISRPEAAVVLFEVAKKEHQFLQESKINDGFELSEIERSDGTDEELHVTFDVKIAENILYFKYSLGFDSDENGYLPYAEVSGGSKNDPLAFSAKYTGGEKYVRDPQELIELVKELHRGAGEVRFEAFQWIEAQGKPHPRP